MYVGRRKEMGGFEKERSQEEGRVNGGGWVNRGGW